MQSVKEKLLWTRFHPWETTFLQGPQGLAAWISVRRIKHPMFGLKTTKALFKKDLKVITEDVHLTKNHLIIADKVVPLTDIKEFGFNDGDYHEIPFIFVEIYLGEKYPEPYIYLGSRGGGSIDEVIQFYRLLCKVMNMPRKLDYIDFLRRIRPKKTIAVNQFNSKTRVIFDKEMYMAGDQVVARINFNDPYPSRMKGMSIRVGSGEWAAIVKVDYVANSQTSYYKQIITYSKTDYYKEIVQYFEGQPEQNEFELVYQLPETSYEPANTFKNLLVFHRVEIFIDRKGGKSKSYAFNIPYKHYIPQIEIKPIKMVERNVSIEIEKDTVFSNDLIGVNLSTTSGTELKWVRLKFEQSIITSLHAKKAIGKKLKEVKQDTRDSRHLYLTSKVVVQEFPLKIEIPYFDISSMKGINADVEYYLVFKINPMKGRKFKIEIPMTYYREHHSTK